MTIVRVGATKKYSDGWESAFGRGKKKAAPASAAKKAGGKTSAAKASTRKKSTGEKTKKK